MVNFATPVVKSRHTTMIDKVVAPLAYMVYDDIIPRENTMDMTIEVAVGYDDNGESIMETLPAKFIVCPECEGHGVVLNPSMAGHCYTQEDFNEAFDDEDDRAEYFKRGGKYDVQCPHCKGKNVVLVVDYLNFTTTEQRTAWNNHLIWQNELWRGEREDEMTMRGESGQWG